MAGAVNDAATDSGGRGVLADIDVITVVGGLWRYRNPGALVARELGLDDVHGMLTTFGGNIPIHVVHVMAERIRAGELDVAVIAGGECNHTRRRLAARGEKPRRRAEIDDATVERWGPPLDMGDRVAIERGGEVPRNSYAVLDSAIRAARGESLDEARDRAANLWAGYADAATTNPHAADRRGLTAAQIRDPAPGNRMVSWPYTKAMCANNDVDRAGAVVICSTEAADRFGVPTERRIHPLRAVTAVDTTSLLERERVHEAVGLRAAAARVVEIVGSDRTIDHVDLYSCFPSIVALTVDALGLDPGRRLTVDGGLAFAGAPLNFAAGQALISMVATLRADPGSIGVVQGNGGHAAKHAFGIYSTGPPIDPHGIDELGSFGTTVAVAEPERVGSATLDGVTVEYGHDGPERAIAIVRFEDGARSWATSPDPVLMHLFTTEEMVGRRVHVDAGEMTAAQPT